MTARILNLKPVQESLVSGRHQIFCPRSGKGPERSVTRGGPMSPTPTAGSRCNLVERTKTH
jgi:hypothetical protein